MTLLCSITLLACQKNASFVSPPLEPVLKDTIWTVLNYPHESINYSYIAICNNQIYIGGEDNWPYDSTFCSTDNGTSWRPVISDIPFYALRGIASTKINSLFAVSGGGLFRSFDNGNSWTSSGINATFWGVNVNSADIIFASTKSSGLFRSTDNGNSWTNITKGLRIPTAYTTIAIKTDSLLFMGGDGLFRSRDSGVSWTQLDSTASYISFVWALGLGKSGEIVIANDHGSTGSGIFVSTDNGDTWNQKRDKRTAYMAINSQGDIFIGDYYTPGIFCSLDNGTSWIPFGFEHDNVNSLAIDSIGYLYTSIINKGLFRTKVSTLH
jgi:photosystem II stability/assembly factor-like uncharacterized protein